MKIPNNENKEKCAKCGGVCCRTAPGCYSADDFGGKHLLLKSLKQGIADKTMQIDWWEDSPQTYFVRPTTKDCLGDNYQIYKGSWGGECVHFTFGVGCALAFEQRPYECRQLVPIIDKDCYSAWSKEESKNSFVPYQDVLASFKKDAAPTEKELTFSDLEFIARIIARRSL